MKGTMSEEKKTDKEIVEILKQRIGFTTQREFAKQVGMSEKNLSDVLYGRRRPQRNLCEFLGVSRIEKSELLKRLQAENASLKGELEKLRGEKQNLLSQLSVECEVMGNLQDVPKKILTEIFSGENDFLCDNGKEVKHHFEWSRIKEIFAKHGITLEDK